VFIITKVVPGLSYWASGGYQAGLTSKQVGNFVHYVRYEPDILFIFSEYSLKYLEYARIYLNIFMSGGHEGLLGITNKRAIWAGGRPNNPKLCMYCIKEVVIYIFRVDILAKMCTLVGVKKGYQGITK
jgi:hypothetical protein